MAMGVFEGGDEKQEEINKKGKTFIYFSIFVVNSYYSKKA